MPQSIKLSKGSFTIVDDCDSDLTRFKWHLGNAGYAVINVRSPEGWTKLTLHRVIMGATSSLQVDHINGNRLDNRRANLRLTTPTQNSQNRSVAKHSRSRFRGVYKIKDRERWAAEIRSAGRKKFLGTFDSPEAAARAYDSAAQQLHGEFARLNFPKDLS